jgi:hypothetical protein
MVEVDEKRQEWQAIYEREQSRRRTIEELRKLVEDMGDSKKTAKTLLKLAVYTRGIKASEASDIIGVKRELVDTWVRVLYDRGFIDVESISHPNPTIRPTKEITNKFNAFQRREQTGKRVDDDIAVLDEPQIKAANEREAEVRTTPAQDETIEQEEPEIELESGTTYLVFDQKTSKAIKVYIKEIRSGARGLFISRSNPNQVKKKYYLGDSKVVWLTSVQSDLEMDSITGLQELSILVSRFIDDNKQSIILLEGIEYLISNNNFPVVLRLIQQLRDKVSTSESKMIIPLNPNTLEDKQISLLENECQTIK